MYFHIIQSSQNTDGIFYKVENNVFALYMRKLRTHKKSNSLSEVIRTMYGSEFKLIWPSSSALALNRSLYSPHLHWAQTKSTAGVRRCKLRAGNRYIFTSDSESASPCLL